MISKEQGIIIIRGKFIYNKDVETQNIMVVEYSGTVTLLSEEPSIFITEEGETNLADFLRNNIKPGEFMTIRKASVDSVEELFNDRKIVDKHTDCPNSNSSYGKFTIDDEGRLKIDNNLIRDVILYKKGITYDYMYLEIYVTAK